MPIAYASEAASELGTETHANTPPPACDSRHVMMLPGAGRMAVTSEKLGEPRIHSVLLSGPMKAVVDVLTRCTTSAPDTATSPPGLPFFHLFVHIFTQTFLLIKRLFKLLS